MLVLHLSDLHLTGANKSFEDVWHGPAAVIKSYKRKFDFVIVSGDLSQSATAAEYELLRGFLEKKVVPLLVNADRARVILVPGNHDIDWTAKFTSTVRSPPGQGTTAQHFARVHATAAHSDFRAKVKTDGSVGFLKIDRERYPLRLANVQGFFKSFYRNSLRAPHRMFALTGGDEAGHFSAHVFPSERVAFYGFSSVHNNDAHWHGAHISSKAVAAAREHADRLGDGVLRVAVWHHGLVSDRGRPDHLTLEDIGVLHSAGFRIGFHGHTHIAAADALDKFFGEHFVVVATGSLGAASEQRPDAVGNQFSIVRLFPGQVHVDVYVREGEAKVYSPSNVRRRLFLLRRADEADDQRTRVALHRRTWSVAANGLAEIDVELEELDLRAPVAIAIVTPPYTQVSADTSAVTDTANLSVERRELPDRRVRFTLHGDPNRYPKCRWKYRASNAVAMTRSDVEAMDHRGQTSEVRWLPKVDCDDEARSHTVRIPCEELVLSYKFAESVIVPGSARAIVERRVDDRGAERWDVVPSEIARCTVSSTKNQATLSVAGPLLDHRYTCVFKLSRPGISISPGANKVVRNVLDLCRQERDELADTLDTAHDVLSSDLRKDIEDVLTARVVEPPTKSAEAVLARHDERARFAQGLVARLTRRVGSALFSDRVLRTRLGRGNSWIGLLWHEERRRLFPAFGRFPFPSWTVRFSSGGGVAGHAFRFNSPAAWTRKASKSSLLYQEQTEIGSPFHSDYQWIVALPIAVPGSAPVGVVSFAGVGNETDADHALYDFAQEMEKIGDRGHLSPTLEMLRNNLQTALAFEFWQTCSTETRLPKPALDEAKSIRATLVDE